MADEVLQVADSFYILSTSARLDDRTRVLKHGDTFAVLDRCGDVEAVGPAELGLYHRDTRHLSHLVLRLGSQRPALLGSTIKDDNALLAVDLMNPDLRNGELVVPRGLVHVFRAKVLWMAACHERLRIHNYGRSPIEMSLALEFGADFADIFEVRGMTRKRRGEVLAAEVGDHEVVLGYRGLDGCTRLTRITFETAPAELSAGGARYDLELPAGGEVTLRFSVHCELRGCPADRDRPAPATGKNHGVFYEKAAGAAVASLERARRDEPAIYTSNEQYNDWLNRSLADLHMLRTGTAHGPYPYAGVPWYSTVFGRDGILTAYECLWFQPAMARGVLAYLAATQASETDDDKDAQPGKILHETRAGEMAALGEVPFGRYYGTVDATPLFVVLAAAYWERTGDDAFVRSIWPAIERALEWVDRYGIGEGGDFLRYSRRAKHGLLQQGWKDSQDSVFYDDGELAEPPIALCEVQGYAHAARLAAAGLGEALGLWEPDRVWRVRESAEELRRAFEDAFWCEELSTYALALDGNGRQCRVRASNAGHCLFAGIAAPDRAARVADTLMRPESFSGWGIRTLAAGEARYNPMSYHNGSVWPHDNAIVAAGFSRYGFKDRAVQVLGGLFDASLFFDLHRLPELFCGFERRPGESPTHYPVACSPQAWTAGAALLLLQACLGLEVRGRQRQVRLTNPLLPESLQQIRIQGLRVQDASLDLVLTRHDRDVGINVQRRTGQVEVVVVK